MLMLHLCKRRLLIQLEQNWRIVSSQSYHTSVVCRRRRGPVSDVTLPEMIVDKPPTYYASIQDKLDRINYYNNPANLIDVGFDKDSQHFDNFVKASQENFRKSSKQSNLEDEDLFEEKQIKLNESDYHNLSSLYSLSQQYLDSTVTLAHHYAIYRDLFFKVPVDLQTCSDLIAENARQEVHLADKSQPQSFYFKPLVPIEAEFSYESGEDLLCQKAFRGNLISPEYGLKQPNISINTSAINGKFEATATSSHSVELNPRNDGAFYTLAMVNLDSHFNDTGLCHWLLTNIHNNNSRTEFETAVKYLPVYGIRGLGYHRYALVLFRHESKIQADLVDDFDLGKRKFNALHFMDQHSGASMKPVGLSWFQTTWNDSCREVFYNYLDMKSPTYEYVHPPQNTLFKQVQYPGRAPFNIYLDSFRDPKDISKSVLLDRLKMVNPFESYKTERLYPTFEGRPRLPHIHPISLDTPEWMRQNIRKKRAFVGRFRGLRPASATLPYNNNADLDAPLWPRINPDINPLNVPNPYPDGKRRPKNVKQTLWAKPLNEHHSLRIDFADSLKGSDKRMKESGKSSEN